MAHLVEFDGRKARYDNRSSIIYCHDIPDYLLNHDQLAEDLFKKIESENRRFRWRNRFTRISIGDPRSEFKSSVKYGIEEVEIAGITEDTFTKNDLISAGLINVYGSVSYYRRTMEFKGNGSSFRGFIEIPCRVKNRWAHVIGSEVSDIVDVMVYRLIESNSTAKIHNLRNLKLEQLDTN